VTPDRGSVKKLCFCRGVKAQSKKGRLFSFGFLGFVAGCVSIPATFCFGRLRQGFEEEAANLPRKW
jgi:hypothetical protein